MRKNSPKKLSSTNRTGGLLVLSLLIFSVLILFLVSPSSPNQNDDWAFSKSSERKLMESDSEKASDWSTDYHDIERQNGNNRFCCFQVDESKTEETGVTTYECDWNGYVENLVYLSIPGIALSILTSILCCGLVIGRNCNQCGGSQPSRGFCCVDQKQFHGYPKKNVLCLKVALVFLTLCVIGMTPLAFYGNADMISGTEESGNDALDAANEANDVAEEVYQQSLLIPNLDQETQDLIQETLNYTNTFVDDANTFKDNMDLVNFWRNILLLLSLSFLLAACLFTFYAVFTNSPRVMRCSNGWLTSIITMLWLLLVLTTVATVVTSDFCWELDYALESPENLRASYIGYLMDCNEEDYTFADLEVELAASKQQLIDETCSAWSLYCQQYSQQVTCDTSGFDCQNDLQTSSQIYNRTTITENGQTYTISECATECTDSSLESSSSDLNSLLVGLDALNEIIVEVAPYTSCTWIYETLDEISNPTCVNGIIGGVYLSIALVLLIALTLMFTPCGFMAIKRLNRQFWRDSEEYVLVRL